ncbi:caspase family protein [Parasphingorhabdus halotolerans]|uniref:Peptidase C14 caspase domain-containing protein n=1 Tax=Parasphingorhabdus halotolerans TaxID=2725558 RepID=A0A6H2DM16_9SPHN|nr:caspase family protein [Parasphingorhabdus halotolerans]QJB68706.1 hypothetical protein HF685_04935 [Parasphingorhabdus halotolerans]
MIRSMLAILLVALFLWPPAAEAKRAALIVANSDYKRAGTLRTPPNDAQLIAESARKAGFDEIIVAENLEFKDFQKTLGEFRAKASGAEVAMVYFSGHGIEGQGKNWLLPVDAKLKTNFDLTYEAIELETVIQTLSSAAIRLIFLDASRNSSFGEAWRAGSKTIPRGLVEIKPDGALLIYAAAAGETSVGSAGLNSRFALSLAERLTQSDLPVQMLGASVRDDISSATGGTQLPFVSASMSGTPVYLVPRGSAAPAAVASIPAPSPAPATPSSNRAGLDALAWRGALSADNIGGYSAYIREFPNGLFADIAQSKIATLGQAAPAPRVSSSALGASAGTSNSVASGRLSLAGSSPQPMDIASSSAPEQPAIAPPKLEGISSPPTTPEPASPQPVAGEQTADDNKVGAMSMERSGADVAPKELAPEDLAYVPPAEAEPPLPKLPPTPILLREDYPDCREDHQLIEAPFDKADDINRCTVLLDKYYDDVLNGYRKRMNQHQDEISAIFEQKVAGNMKYSAATRDRFYKEVMQEHADSNPDGVNLETYRAAVALYNQDRNYLSDRFCYNTGCNGYPMPQYVASKKKPKSGGGAAGDRDDGEKSARNSQDAKKCKKSRSRGQLLGGIFGGLVGKAAGLGKVGTLLASGAGALLVGELACQLDEKEQEKAGEATVLVAQKEEVGAKVEWQSPTRSGVSGSSTITALNTQPNGRRCLSITDVAIIDGEETRIAKQMCKGVGDERYAIMA